MPDADGSVSSRQLPASGTDSKSSKVKAYWGKTIPVTRNTPAVPLWHRLGWNSKYVHQEDTSDRAPARGSCCAEHHDRVYSGQHTAYARCHTHMHSHSQSQQGKHRLVLQQSWVPGMNGAPQTQENHSAWCSELDGELMHIHQTLQSIKSRSAQRSKQHRLEQGQTDTADVDTVMLRARINASVASQIDFFTAIQNAWCGQHEGAAAAAART